MTSLDVLYAKGGGGVEGTESARAPTARGHKKRDLDRVERDMCTWNTVPSVQILKLKFKSQ